MSRCKYFKIEELVSKETFDLIKEDTLWKLFDAKLLVTIDALKEKFPEGTMSINTWKWQGDRNQSGLRTKDSEDYSATSQHSLGKAIDCIFSDYDEDSVRQYVINNPDEFPYIKGIELNVSWCHFDVRSSDRVVLFSK